MTAPAGEEWKDLNTRNREADPDRGGQDPETARAPVPSQVRGPACELRLVDRFGAPMKGL